MVSNKDSSRNIARWSNDKEIQNPEWEQRSFLASHLIPAGSVVLDIGCGNMRLKQHLPDHCQYIPADLIKRDADTLLCDLNNNSFPPKNNATIITLLGVFEYMIDLPGVIKKLCAYQLPMLISYNFHHDDIVKDRSALGWVNDFTDEDMLTIFRTCHYEVKNSIKLPHQQQLLLLYPQQKHCHLPKRRKNVLVFSCNNLGNMGDRIGYHLINSLIPANCYTTYINFYPWHVPEKDYDLLILGIGNSLYHVMLHEKFLDLINSVPKVIGIFGTQYRDFIETEKIKYLLNRVDHWFARYQEDILIYGQYANKVTHLGDWLIDAFPMVDAIKDETIQLAHAYVEKEHALDRMIQHIQTYQRVFSEKLHPLLCALTSAKEVAYQEQYLFGDKPSGKFRSMLLDIFNFHFPEKSFFSVQKQQVIEYKQFVSQQMHELKNAIAQCLND